MTVVTLREAQSTLADLIDRTPAGESVVITRDEQPIAELFLLPAKAPRPVFGSCKDRLTVLADDDEHLADFAEYMQ